MDEQQNPKNEIQRQLAYYKRQLDRMSGEGIRNDYVQSSLRHELKQTKDALGILISLQKEFSENIAIETIFYQTVRAITARLNMNHAIILSPQPKSKMFKPVCSFGFPHDQALLVEKREIELPERLMAADQYLLHNKSSPINDLTLLLQKNFLINFFIGVPILIDLKPIAFIIADRELEKIPFILPLDKGDGQTLIAVAGLISSIMQSRNLVEIKLQKEEIEKQRDEITVQRDILEKTLAELKNTQAQLIQKEKMASLGELTAGIAHEIQNPLNFVNNFSEVNKELVDELKQEIDKGNLNEVKAIAKDIKDNEDKINHHGKRADAIVKNMLQHSRSSSGIKEPTDINALCDEYLRLSYHGMRAKDKNFNADMQTDFDGSIGKINIVPQDIGRVLLNLFNNAFYSVNEKAKTCQAEPTSSADSPIEAGYEPAVKVSTKKIGDKISISVKDNGNGIPDSIKEKIFQPFFTTKPTGEGTGLGLSLSYDIIKADGGEIKVKTTEGEGSKFIVMISS